MKNIEALLKRIDEKKKKLDSFRPLPRELVQNLDEWFKITFTYNSNAIEGNTLTHQETALVVEKGITIGGKTLREHLEAINHAQAIDFIKSLVAQKPTGVGMDDILAIHKIVLQKIDDINAGVLLPELISTQDHPVIIAALAHFRLVSIHPFIDGNGRTARLLMNLLLLQHGYPCAIIKTEERARYIKAIEQAREQEDFSDFYTLICDAVGTTLDSYLEAIEQSDMSAR